VTEVIGPGLLGQMLVMDTPLPNFSFEIPVDSVVAFSGTGTGTTATGVGTL
jgi:hypothetical protein